MSWPHLPVPAAALRWGPAASRPRKLGLRSRCAGRSWPPGTYLVAGARPAPPCRVGGARPPGSASAPPRVGGGRVAAAPRTRSRDRTAGSTGGALCPRPCLSRSVRGLGAGASASQAQRDQASCFPAGPVEVPAHAHRSPGAASRTRVCSGDSRGGGGRTVGGRERGSAGKSFPQALVAVRAPGRNRLENPLSLTS